MTGHSGTRQRIIPSTTGVLASIAAAALVAGAGCDNRADEIRSYTIPKETPPPISVPMQQQAQRPAAGPMQWDLPDGWTQIANPNPMRFATLTAGEGDERIEVAISQLAGAAGGIAANINRWRGQIGLPPASESELAGAARPIVARGAQGVMVDLVGVPPEGSDAPGPRMLAAIFPAERQTWFIKTTAHAPVMDNHTEAFVTLCESVRFSSTADGILRAGAVSPAAPAPDSPTWELLPDGWSVDAAPAAMSVASFTVRDGSQEASLSITPLGGTQDLLANVNRWRGQVGLEPLAELAESPPVSLEVAGRPGSLVDVAGPDRRTLVVISTRGATTWFYKLSGPDGLVAGQRTAFEAFIGSIRFEGDSRE